VARRSTLAIAAAAALGSVGVAAGGAYGAPKHGGHILDRHHSGISEWLAPSKHVLLISVDGLHQSDLQWWVRHYPNSNLAKVVDGGMSYTNASTPIPSDSFPGLVAQVTGGNPGTTGVYYDDTWNRGLLPPGSACTPGQTTGLGTEVTYFEALDWNLNSIDAGFGIPNLYPGLSLTPPSVLALPGDIPTVDTKEINPANLPIDPTTCKVVYPHQYLHVNTIFEVAHNAGLRTAWTDKHVAYEITAGPSGKGVDDLFGPEINSSATDPSLPAGPTGDWTTNNQLTQQYDAIKVQSILNEIDGYDHSGTMPEPVPGIFGMNFQTVSTAEKLPLSPLAGTQQAGGYVLDNDSEWVPGPVLTDALGFVDTQIGRLLTELKHQHLLGSTTLVLSAKHGQSPIQGTALKRINDGYIIDALNKAWDAKYNATTPLVTFAIDDDAMYIWLADRSEKGEGFAKWFLMHYAQPASAMTGGKPVATDINGTAIGFTASGLKSLTDGPQFFHVPFSDPRAPDLVGVVQHGVVYTGGTKKIAEHGGSDPQDRHVPIVVFGAGVWHHGSSHGWVETTQIAPTILKLLGLNPWLLQAVQIEHTRTLPGLF
jgi:hypothetical protein